MSSITRLLAITAPVFLTSTVNDALVPAVAVPPSGVLAIVSAGICSVALASSAGVPYGPSALPLLPASSLAELTSALLTFASIPRPGDVAASAVGLAS